MSNDKNIFLVVTESYQANCVDILAVNSNKEIVLKYEKFYLTSARTKTRTVEKFIEILRNKRVFLADAEYYLKSLADFLSCASEIVLCDIADCIDADEIAAELVDKYL